MAVAVGRVDKARVGGMTGGSGWLLLVPIDRGGQCGSNGTGWDVAVAVLAEL
jgi:hypothetical protein